MSAARRMACLCRRSRCMDIPPGVGVRAPRQAAYHSIVQLDGYGAARVPHSRLDAVPRLVAAPDATSDNGLYGAHGNWEGGGKPKLSLLENCILTLHNLYCVQASFSHFLLVAFLKPALFLWLCGLDKSIHFLSNNG